MSATATVSSAPPTAAPKLTERIGRIEVSATMAVTAAAAKLRAEGVKLVDFGAGEPHFATPRHIKDAAIAAIEANFSRYTVVSGIAEVRKAIVERHATDFGSNYTPDEAVFTTGGKLALFNAIEVLVDHGDEVILPVPYWVSYKDIIQYAGGKVVYLETAESENFRVTAEAIESAITPRHQGDHPELAVESFRSCRRTRGPGAHCAPGAQPRHLPAAGRVLRLPDLQ